jgi:hypothetical protein
MSSTDSHCADRITIGVPSSQWRATAASISSDDR